MVWSSGSQLVLSAVPPQPCQMSMSTSLCSNCSHIVVVFFLQDVDFFFSQCFVPLPLSI